MLYGSPGGRALRRYNLRQGLDPVLDASVGESYRGAGSGHIEMFLSPDKTKLVAINGNTGDSIQYWTWEDTTNPNSIRYADAAFSGNLSCCACSNEYWAIGGASPSYLMVFDWATYSLQPLAISGLGTVTSIAFSPDGTKLAVAHDTSPYLRVYDTSDWSYVNAATSAGASRQGVCFTSDGSAIVTNGRSSPYLTVFTPDLATRTYNSTSSTFSGASSFMGICPHPTKPKSVIGRAGNSTNSTYRKLYEFNTEDNTVTDIIPAVTTVVVLGVAFDATLNQMFVTHGSWDNRTVTIFDLTTYEQLPEQPLIFRINNNGNVFPLVLERDIYRISGTVRDINNDPASREVLAFSRATGELVGKAISDPVSGDYEIIVPDEGPYDVQFRIADGELLNDLFYARVIPQPVT